MMPYGAENIRSDLSRIRAAIMKVDMSISLQEIAPSEAGRLLREAEEELQRQIARLSPRRRERSRETTLGSMLPAF